MSKTKKSKLLASMLCATVVAGLYAGPVMAGNQMDTKVDEGNSLTIVVRPGGGGLDGDTYEEGKDGMFNAGGGFAQVAGQLTIKSSDLVTALKGSNMTLGAVTADSLTIGKVTLNTENITKWNEHMNASEDHFEEIDQHEEELEQRMQAEEQALEKVEDKTANITGVVTDGGKESTTFKGKIIADKFGNSSDTFWVDAKGQLSAANMKFYVGASGEFKAANGNFEVKNNGDVVANGELKSANGLVAGTDGNGTFKVKNIDGNTMAYMVDKDGNYTVGINAQNGNIETKGALAVTNAAGNNVFTANSDGMSVGGGNFAVDAATGNTKIAGGLNVGTNIEVAGGITANSLKLGAIDNVEATINALDEGLGNVGEAVNGLEGKVNVIENNTTGISYDKGVTTIAETAKFGKGYMQVGSTILAKDGSIGAANGKFTVTPDGEVIVSGENGSTNINGNGITVGDTVITNGVITTHKADIGGVEIANGRVDGVDVSELAGSVFDSGKDISDLKRKTTDIEYADGVTTVSGVEFKDGTITAGNGNFSVSENGVVTASAVNASIVMFEGGSITNAGIRAIDGKFVVDYEGNVKAAGDVTSANYSLEAVGDQMKNVEGITRENGVTDIEGVAQFGNGSVKVNGAMQVAGDKFVYSYQDEEGNLRVGSLKAIDTSIDALEGKTTDIKYADGVTEIGKGVLAVNNEGYVTINNGMLVVDGDSGYVDMGNNIHFDTRNGVINAQNVYSANYNLEDVGDQLNKLETGVGETNKNVAGITRKGEVTTIEGATSFDANGMKVGNNVTINKDGSMTARNGDAYFNFDQGNVALGNGTNSVMVGNNSITLDADGTTLTMNHDGLDYADGAFTVRNDGTVYANGSMTADDFITKDGIKLSEVNDKLGDLEGSVGETNKNVAGIRREEVNGDYVTVIEDYMRISNKGVSLDADKFGFTYTTSDGSIGVGNLGDLANKVNEIDDRLDVVEDKTQNINGSGEIGKPGEGGNQIEVPPTTDGETGINGDATVGGDLTVGGSVTAGEGNFSDKVTVGGENGTSIDKDGVNVGGENGTSITDKDVVINQGTDNEVRLSDVGNRVDNLEQGMASMSNRISKVEDRIDKVGAMSAAIANLRTMGYDPAAPTEIAVGIGQYRSETGAALGLFHYPNKDFMLSLSVSTSGDEVMGGIGATWKFGRKSPEQMLAAEKEKAAKAKLAKAEAMKKAAAEAKVAEQQAKHAKMAAEKAAK